MRLKDSTGIDQLHDWLIRASQGIGIQPFDFIQDSVSPTEGE